MQKNLKAHAFETHMVEQFDEFGGLSEFREDFIELSHQDGVREEKRTSNLSNRAQAALSHCRWEYRKRLPVVKRIQEKVREGGKRKLVSNKAEDRKKKMKMDKEADREAARERTDVEDKTVILTGRQRNMKDHRAPDNSNDTLPPSIHVADT